MSVRPFSRPFSGPDCPKMALFGLENSIFSMLCPYNPLFWPHTDPAQWNHVFSISQGNFGCLRVFQKIPFGRSAGRILAQIAQKWPFFGLKMLFFLRYAHITHFFGLRKTRLNGIISSQYPKVTLDAFGFQEDARLSARQAVFWHQLPKMAIFWAKNATFSMLRLYNPYFWP